MRTRFVLIGTLAAALTLYAWQVVSNVAIPWHETTMREFTNNDAVVQAIRANAPENDVYFSPQGVFGAVSFTPDLADKTQMMGGMMVRQAGIDLAVALLLCLLVMRLPAASAVRTGGTVALAALAAGAVVHLSNANWYGFPLDYALVNTADLTIGWFLAGLVLGAVAKRDRPASAEEASGIGAPGGLAAPQAGGRARV